MPQTEFQAKCDRRVFLAQLLRYTCNGQGYHELQAVARFAITFGCIRDCVSKDELSSSKTI